MDEIFIVIFFSLIGGLFSLIGGVILLKRKQITDNFINYVTPFAAGALLAAVFMDFLPEGVHQENGDTVFIAALVGILGFFLAERFLRWFHHHHEDDEGTDPSAKLIIAGDIAHNALDGVAIAAAFLVSVPTGIVTTIAVAAHEIPQEIGDFGLLLSKGMKRRRVLIVNVLSALATTLAAVITYVLGSDERLPVALLLGVSAGFLLYIALSDVIPTIHHRADKSKLLQWQTAMLLVGVVVVGLAVSLAHSYIDTNHLHDHSTTESVEHDRDKHNH